MRTIIDQTSGKVLYSIIDEIEIELMPNEMIIYEVVTEEFSNPYYDFDQNTFYNVEETVI